MMRFVLNGYVWDVRVVAPVSRYLIDRSGESRLATTDPNMQVIFLSSALSGWKLIEVLIHELGHCALFSYHLLDDIHQVVNPRYWVIAEEWLCNFIADYGMSIFSVAYDLIGANVWDYISYKIDELAA